MTQDKFETHSFVKNATIPVFRHCCRIDDSEKENKKCVHEKERER